MAPDPTTEGARPEHPGVARLLASPAFGRATAALARDHDRLVAETIALQQIPAPFRQEARKGAAFAAMLAEAGLGDVATDAEGNVTGLLRGTARAGSLLAVVSHLDTVFPAGTDLKVRRDGTRIIAPGIADDTRGLASQLALIRAIAEAGIRHGRDILFVGSVGEEGLGDLRGVKHLFGETDYGRRIGDVVALDGSMPDQIVNEAVGSRRFVVRFMGPGGHSYAAFGTVNPVFALATATEAFGRTEAPPGATYSIGLLGGGTSVNAIPTEAWMQVDLRSADPADLAALGARLETVVADAVRRENGARSTRSGAITATFELVGDRPSGRNPDDAEIVRVALACSRAHGFTPRLVASSTDANVPISLGIPAVTVASGIGGRAHSPDEYLDVDPGPSLRALGAALGLILTLAGAEPD